MAEWLIRYRGYILITLLNVVVTGVVVVFLNRPAPRAIAIQPATPAPPATAAPARIAVYVSGAVQAPGVYDLPEGARVAAALEAAGGPTAEADLARVNLAHRLRDEEQVYVPRVGETSPPVVSPGGEAGSGSALVNINTATSAEFETLPGIGPALAQRIIEHREKNGPFASIEDIKQVSGIGDKLFDRIKDLITV